MAQYFSTRSPSILLCFCLLGSGSFLTDIGVSKAPSMTNLMFALQLVCGQDVASRWLFGSPLAI